MTASGSVRMNPPPARSFALPFLEIKIVNADDYLFFCDTLFASDRDMIAKGMIEVSL